MYCRTIVTDPSCPRSAGVVIINDRNHGGRLGGLIGGYLRGFCNKVYKSVFKDILVIIILVHPYFILFGVCRNFFY